MGRNDTSLPSGRSVGTLAPSAARGAGEPDTVAGVPAAGSPMAIYHGAVNAGQDGPVEACVPCVNGVNAGW